MTSIIGDLLLVFAGLTIYDVNNLGLVTGVYELCMTSNNGDLLLVFADYV